MTIPASLLQSQMSVNRTNINRLNNELYVEFCHRQWYKEHNDERVKDCNRYIAKLRKHISRLVQLQKALKAELERQHRAEAVSKILDDLRYMQGYE